MADNAPPSVIDLLDIEQVCTFFGGSKPLHAATIYRGVASGIYPKPVKIGPNTNRWLRSECAAALQKLIESRAA